MEQNKSLESIFLENNDRLIHKWSDYFFVYERYFNKYRNKPVTILEIGVFHGGSLQMWKKYFGKDVTIYGIDINPECKSLEEENIHIFIGSQSDKNFLEEVKRQIPKVDILLDDGGHTMKQQKVTFEELFDHVKEDGVYICEDCHTSYWPFYGGGYLRKGTFIEYSKKLIDKLTAWHFYQLPVDNFTRSVLSISYYDSMVVIEKKKMEEPKDMITGQPSFEMSPHQKFSLRFKIKLLIEKTLAKMKISSPFYS